VERHQKRATQLPCTGCACVFNVLLAFSSHPVKFVEKLDQRPLFDPRYVGRQLGSRWGIEHEQFISGQFQLTRSIFSGILT